MKKPLFNKIAIVGVGLVGGSLGLAIKRKKLARFVIGIARREKTLREAFHRKAIDVGTLDLKRGVEDADIVILAGPVSAIVSQLQGIQKFLKKGALVIDVGSSKELIDRTAKKYLKNNIFIGCHPMAGSEKTGVENSCSYLFERSICFVTKSNAKVNGLWRSLGSAPVLISATKHDDWAARVSHLPHVLGFSIFQDLKSPVKVPLNPSLRSLGRLAKSDPMLWVDVLLSNKRPMLSAISNFERNLKLFRRAIAMGSVSALKRLIQKSNLHAA